MKAPTNKPGNSSSGTNWPGLGISLFGLIMLIFGCIRISNGWGGELYHPSDLDMLAKGVLQAIIGLAILIIMFKPRSTS